MNKVLLLPATYWVKVRYGGFLPLVEMTCEQLPLYNIMLDKYSARAKPYTIAMSKNHNAKEKISQLDQLIK